MAVRIEDAGFEIRDMIAWVYGSGFPKSLDVSKAIDKAAGAEREVVGQSTNGIAGGSGRHVGEEGAYGFSGSYAITAPATDAARQWAGWGTALKPALEPITVARKPLAGTVAETVLAYGTGAINVDGCRVGDGADKGDWPITQRRHADVAYTMGPVLTDKSSGRWPANLIHDGGPDVADLLGEAARFFYCAKASRADRDGGLEGFDLRSRPTMGSGIGGQPDQSRANNRNHHPTVKPTDLMRYLCRLVTQPGGVVLDPFMGSGSTGRGAVLEGFAFVGIEREADYLTIAQARIEAAQQEAQVERPQPSLFDQVAD